jgi:hypothetical protein
VGTGDRHLRRTVIDALIDLGHTEGSGNRRGGQSIWYSARGTHSVRREVVPLGHDVHVVAGVVEASAAGFGHGDDVFDAHAEPAGKVDAGLDGEAHAWFERLGLALDQVGGS